MSFSEQLIEHSEDIKEYLGRYPYFYTGIVIAFLILFSRLWYLQIIKGNELKTFSERNQIRKEKIEAPRGMFTDREGQLLVDSRPTFNVLLTPQYIVSLDKTSKSLAKVLDMKSKKIREKVRIGRRKNGVFRPVRIKENVSRDEVIRVERMKIDTPGLGVEMGIRRNYLLGENGAQLFGYTGEISREELPRLNKTRNFKSVLKAGDVIGKSGLEKKWDNHIRGVNGARFVAVDVRGRRVAAGKDLKIGGYPEGTDYVPGQNINLTIDKDLQNVMYDSFKKNDRIGSGVALDPKTGEILAFVSLPSFDPNHFSTGIPMDIWANLINDPFKPLRNKVVQDPTPPGSVFKAITALAALQEKIVTPRKTYFCPGFLKFGRRRYHCHLERGHGYVNVYQALEQSCDVYFYHVSLALGIDRIAKYARLLGLGKKTGIQLSNERAGLIPDSQWKKQVIGEIWQPGENLVNAIGQGFILTTPVQLANTYAAIGQDGKAFRPHIIKSIKDVDGNIIKEFKAEPVIEVGDTEEGPGDVSTSTFKAIRRGLFDVFNGKNGTARRYKIKGLDVAGKTGTVQLFRQTVDTVYKRCEGRALKHRSHGWLVAYAPEKDPQIAVAIHTEHSCHGTSSGPIVKDVLMAYFKKYAPHLLPQPKEKLKPVISKDTKPTETEET